MSRKHTELITTVLAALAVGLFLVRFIAVSQHYPFYYIWDMDYVTTLDTMLINSGSFPDHINHPCFGMYLTQTNSERIGRALGVLSASRLQDLTGALNPLAAVAEVTAFLRLHSPFVAIFLVLLTWMGLSLILRPGRWIGLLFLVLLGMQESLVYHASLIRTELYAMMFWSGALCLLGAAVRARSPRGSVAALVACGVCLGLSFLTKIQIFFHLVAFGMLGLLTLTMARPASGTPRLPEGRRAARTMMVIGLANLGVFLLLLALIQTPMGRIPEGYKGSTFLGPQYKNFQDGFRPNLFTVFFGAFFFGLAGIQGYLYRKDRAGSRMFVFASGCSLLMAGFLGAFLTHFLEFANPIKSLTYLLYDFKMVFYRDITSQQNLNYIIVEPLAWLKYHPVMFGVHLALLAILAVGFFRKAIAITNVQLALCAALSALALAMLQVSVRYFTRDILWEELLLNVINAYFCVLIWRHARWQVRRLRGAVVTLLLALLAAETAHSLEMPRRIDMNYSQYGWKVDIMRNKVYENNQAAYEKIMHDFYTPVMWKRAKDSIYDYDWRRRTASFIFQNQDVTQRQLGLVAEDFPVWCRRPEWRISAYSQALRNATVVDSSALPLKKHYFTRASYIEDRMEYLDKFKPAPGQGVLSVLARADMQTLLFIRPGVASALGVENLAASPMRIMLKKGNETMELVGLAIRNYAEIPVASLGEDYFFVLLRL